MANAEKGKTSGLNWWDWSWDEHVLALSLYLKHEGKLPSQDHADIVELSDFLRAFKPQRVQINPKYRNANGVLMKLANFRRLDPNFEGTGLKGGSHIERDVWDRYVEDPDDLQSAVQAIRVAMLQQGLVEPAQTDDDEGTPEGSILVRLHKRRERSRQAIADKKSAVLKATGILACEVCEMTFGSRYGAHGDGFIEVHHINPIALSEPERKTKNTDLACVCANCHRMLHRNGLQTIEWLRDRLK